MLLSAMGSRIFLLLQLSSGERPRFSLLLKGKVELALPLMQGCAAFVKGLRIFKLLQLRPLSLRVSTLSELNEL